MPECGPPQTQDVESPSYTDPVESGHLREVRVHYGLASVTISVVEVSHTPRTWRGSSKLLSIHQFTLEEFKRNGSTILRNYADELLLPTWRLSEGQSDSAG
jgi:hypothetical protein